MAWNVWKIMSDHISNLVVSADLVKNVVSIKL